MNIACDKVGAVGPDSLSVCLSPTAINASKACSALGVDWLVPFNVIIIRSAYKFIY